MFSLKKPDHNTDHCLEQKFKSLIQKKFLVFLKKYSGSNILEIGSGPLKPYHNLIKKTKFKKWISIEPSSSVKSNKVKNSRIKILGFFVLEGYVVKRHCIHLKKKD